MHLQNTFSFKKVYRQSQTTKKRTTNDERTEHGHSIFNHKLNLPTATNLCVIGTDQMKLINCILFIIYFYRRCLNRYYRLLIIRSQYS